MEQVTVEMIVLHEKERQELLLPGEYKSETLRMREPETNTEMEFNFKKKTLTRTTKEYRLTIPFEEEKKTKLTIEFLKENETMPLTVETKKYQYQDRHLLVQYKIVESGERFEYKIKF